LIGAAPLPAEEVTGVPGADDLSLLLLTSLLACDDGEPTSSDLFETEAERDFLRASLALHCSSDSKPVTEVHLNQ